MVNLKRAAKSGYSKSVRLFQTSVGLLTLPVKIKPDFFIIGAAKCGTTSLREYLRLHDSIHRLPRLSIEIPHWTRQTSHWRNRARYASHLHRVVQSGSSDEYRTFVKNNGYLDDFRVPKRMWEHNPEAKFIVLLRDPVDRTISQYYHNRRIPNRELLSFREAIERERSRIEPEIGQMRQDQTYLSDEYGWFAYTQKSKYIEQIENWLNYFPEEQFLFLQFEQFFKNPEENLQEVFEFIGVQNQTVTINREYNTGDYLQDIEQDLIEDLKNEFAPYNERLRELIDREITWDY